MPVDVSHFSVVGFPVEMTSAGMSRAAQASMSGCTPSSLDEIDIVCLVRDPSGAELRISLKKGTSGGAELVGMNPAFVGQGRTPVEIASDVSDPAFRPFEITL